MTQVHAVNTKKRLIIGLFLGVGGLCALYMYLISASIIHVVLQRETEQSIGKHAAKLGVLEHQFLTRRDGITVNLALAEGFVPVSGKNFASRRSLLTTALAIPRDL